MHPTLRRSRTTAVLTLALLFLATAPTADAQPTGAAAENDNVARRIRVTSELEMNAGAIRQQIETDTTLDYTLQRQPDEVTLVLDSTRVVATVDGQPLMDMEMSADGMVQRSGGQVTRTAVADAPAEVQLMLRDSFGTPLARIKVDENGKEIERVLSEADGAADLINNGQVDNARLFHPPFYDDRDEWESEAAISMGNGNSARGELTYTPDADADVPAGQVMVRVTGTLNGSGRQGPVEIRDAVYTVEGHQVYDRASNSWISGEFDIDLRFRLLQGDQEVATATGEMRAALEARD